MAIPYRLVDSSSRVVHTNDDMELESFIGLSMPLRNSELTGSIGYFASTSYTVDAIKENVKNILSTHKEERIFRPSIGINWNKFLFQQIDANLIDGLKNEIRTSILSWMPFLKIRKLEVERDGETSDDNFLFVKLIIEYKNELLPLIYTLPVYDSASD